MEAKLPSVSSLKTLMLSSEEILYLPIDFSVNLYRYIPFFAPLDLFSAVMKFLNLVRGTTAEYSPLPFSVASTELI